MKKYIFLLTGILFAILVSCNNSGNVNSISIIPQPSHITVNSGHFTFNRYTSVYVSDNSAQLASYAQYLSNLFAVPAGFNLRIREGSYEGRGNSIVLDMTGSPDELGNEGYKLAVSERRIIIKAAAPAGIFYGIQTIRQLLPPQIESEVFEQKTDWSIPCVEINDKPQYGWRGLLFDGEPSEFNINTLKKYIDNMALLKMNIFEWPIIGRNGLRFQLGGVTTFEEQDTTATSSMKEKISQPLYPVQYTKKEVAELVKYALQRNVRIVPVINLGAIRAGNGYSREGIINSILNLFPTGYAHFIKGDCSDIAQASYLAATKRIKAVISGSSASCSTGNPMIVAWENKESGLYLAKTGRSIVWAPQEYCQLNYPQGTLDTDPFAGESPLSLKSCYDYSPGKFLNKQELENIRGVQGNLFNNVTLTAAKAEFFLYPRICAIAETGWSNNDTKDWSSFSQRLPRFFKRLDKKWINYSRSAYTINYTPTAGNKRQLLVNLKTEATNLDIHYTIDGSLPTLRSPIYEDTLRLFKTTHVRAAAFKDGKRLGEVSNRSFYFHKAAYKHIFYLQPYDSAFASSKEIALVDCLNGSSDYRSGLWQGFRGNDMDLIIDLGEPTIISKLQMNFFHYPNRLIFVPHLVSVQISMNGIDFNPVRFVDLQKQNENDAIFVYPLSIDFDPIQTRYVKIMAPNGFPKDLKISPKTELKPRIFIDEIIVE